MQMCWQGMVIAVNETKRVLNSQRMSSACTLSCTFYCETVYAVVIQSFWDNSGAPTPTDLPPEFRPRIIPHLSPPCPTFQTLFRNMICSTFCVCRKWTHLYFLSSCDINFIWAHRQGSFLNYLFIDQFSCHAVSKLIFHKHTLLKNSLIFLHIVKVILKCFNLA